MHKQRTGRGATDTLIVAPRGRICDGLSALLDTLPLVGSVARAAGAEEAAGALRAGRFGLVLLDAGGVGGNWEGALARLRDEAPAARFLSLVEDAEGLRAARAAGADGTLIKGFSVEQLVAAVEGLLVQGGAREGGRFA